MSAQASLNKVAKKLLMSQIKQAAISLTTPDKSLSISGSQKGSSGKKSKKDEDEYELPAIEEGLDANINPEDPRYDDFDFDKEYRDYLIHSRPDLADLDLKAIDQLPIEVRYELITELRDKSRQTSSKRLDFMKKNASTGIDFSQLQIQNLVHRNDLTQKYLEVAGISDRNLPTKSGRVVQDKRTTFTLTKSEGDKLGWKLSGRTGASALANANQPMSQDSPIRISSDAPIPSEGDPIRNQLILNSMSNPPSSTFKISSDDLDNAVFTKVDISSNPPNPASDVCDEPNFQSTLRELNAWKAYLPPNISTDIPDPLEYHHQAINEWDLDRVKSEVEALEKRADAELAIETKQDELDGLFSYIEFLNTVHKYRNQVSFETMSIPSSPPIDTLNDPSVEESSIDLIQPIRTSSPKRGPSPILSSSDVFKGPTLIDTDFSLDSGGFAEINFPPTNMAEELEQTSKLIHNLVGKRSISVAQQQVRQIHRMSPTMAAKISKRSQGDHEESTTPKSPTKSSKRRIPSYSNEILQFPAELAGSQEASPVRAAIPPIIKSESPAPEEIKIENEPEEVVKNENLNETINETIREISNISQQTIGTEADLNEFTNDTTQQSNLSLDASHFQDAIELQSKQDITLEDMAMELEEQLDTEEFLTNLRDHTLDQVQKDIERDVESLSRQVAQQAARGQEVTPAMVEDIYRLLNLLGIPFVLAPSEAEAQCVELVNLGLAEGIVTDDSDCFLFGKCKIYRNMFSAKNDVEFYQSRDLENYLQLSRERMIQLAQLLGSDYTEGIHGIGAVLALEILAEWPENDGLAQFKYWWDDSVKDSLHPPAKESTLKKRLRKMQTRIFLPDHFPEDEVTQAYLNPVVNSSDQPFQWGEPNVPDLERYLFNQLGWRQDKINNLLEPVLTNRDALKSQPKQTQSLIADFFTTTPQVHSRRVASAVERLRRFNDPTAAPTLEDELDGSLPLDLELELDQLPVKTEQSEGKRRRRGSKSK